MCIRQTELRNACYIKSDVSLRWWPLVCICLKLLGGGVESKPDNSLFAARNAKNINPPLF